MPERSHAIKQSVTVHEKSRKAESSDVHWKRAMKLIFSCSLFQKQLLFVRLANYGNDIIVGTMSKCLLAMPMVLWQLHRIL